MNISPEQFLKHLNDQQKAVKKFMEKDAPREIGTEAVNHFKENFQNEGFTDQVNKPWTEIKRRIEPERPDRAAAKRKILTESGDLGKSIQKDVQTGQVVIFSDVSYAEAHNEGTDNAGQNHNVTIPKRQFIGKSRALDRKVEGVIKERLKHLLG